MFTPSVCIYCGCGCALNLVVHKGRVVSVEPRGLGFVNEGMLCAKGWLCYEVIHSPERLTKPLVREGSRVKEATWRGALKKVALEIRKVVKDDPSLFGLITSAKITNEECYLSQKLARVLMTNNVDQSIRLCHSPSIHVLSKSLGFFAATGSIKGIASSDCVFIVGANVTETNPLIASRIFEAKAKGASLIVLDPRRTRIAQLADFHIKPRPNTDHILLVGVAKAVVAKGLHNMDFIKRHCEGFYVYLRRLNEVDLGKVSSMTGVEVKDIEMVSEVFARSRRACIIYGAGVTQQMNGVNVVSSLMNLMLLTGKVGDGCGLYPLHGQNNAQGACDMGCLPEYFPGYRRTDDLKALNEFSKLWGFEAPSTAGLSLMEQLEAAYRHRLRVLYVIGANPLLSAPESGFIREALRSVEFLVVQEVFMNETAELADVLLPASTWAEKTGTFTSLERRVQLINKAINPVGRSLPDWEIICRLAREMGLRRFFPYSSPADIFEEIRHVVPAYAGITYERLAYSQGIFWPCLKVDSLGVEALSIDRLHKGRGFFQPLVKLEEEALEQNYPFTLTTGRAYHHHNTGSMTRKTALINQGPPVGYVEVNPKDAEKLKLSSGQEVIVESPQGVLKLKARVTDIAQEGVIFIPIHPPRPAVNMLISRKLCRISRIPSLKKSAVKISLG